MIHTALLCPECKALYNDRFLSQCPTGCDVRLIKLYDEWQVKNIIEDFNNIVKIVFDSIRIQLRHKILITCVNWVQESLQQHLNQHHHNNIDIIWDKIWQTKKEVDPTCQFCSGTHDLKKIVIHNEYSTFECYVCLMCRVKLRYDITIEYPQSIVPLNRQLQSASVSA